jgi:hypothetical protein
MVGRGSAVADVDQDGDLDLFIVDLGGPSRLFENVVGSRRSWISVEPLVGAAGETALGTRVRVTAGGRAQTQTFFVSSSYASGSLTSLHFGLGEADLADVEVLWPDGRTQAFPNVPARGAYRVDRSRGLERRRIPVR